MSERKTLIIALDFVRKTFRRTVDRNNVSRPAARSIADDSGRGFMGALARVGGAAAFAQLASVAISPVLTRMYGHAEFGVFGVFLSCATVLAAIAPLGYPEGLLAPPGRRQADAIFSASMLSAVVVGSICAAIAASALWLHPRGADLMPWWAGLLLAPTVVGMALIYSIQIFVAREANWRAAQDMVVAQACLRVSLQVGFAFLGIGALGIASAEAAMRSLTAAFGVWRIRASLAERIRTIPLSEVVAEARRYWRFPALRMPSSLLNNIATLAPAPLIAGLYGVGSAGLWVLVDQVINVPLGFVNKTAGDVFAGYFTRAFHSEPTSARRLFWGAALALVPIGLVPCLTLVFFGPDLFAFAFGSSWRPAGELAGVLSWVLLARFVVQPLSWACNTVNRPEAKLAFDVFQLAAVGAAFFFAWRNALDFADAIRLVAAAFVVAYFALLMLTAWAIYTPRSDKLPTAT